ncbi:MAG TPA: substrate-binding domain-containing protein [Gemmatimonadales bacterium]|nr:substrate-binding domain-containing protein [Gemmatimonadales bacterium]
MKPFGNLLVPRLCLLLAACSSSPRPLRLGTTTTVEQSGVLALVDSLWRGDSIRTIVAPSGQTLRTAAQGDLDVVITHAPALEAKFLWPDHALVRCPFVASRFAVVGPARDPVRVATAPTAAEAFRRIAGGKAPFVSRADSSGTHIKELAIWTMAGIQPQGRPWYVESGVGQAQTLLIADERSAYALADLPTFAKLNGVALRILFTADTFLLNPYTLYVVRTRSPHPSGMAFANWAMDTWRNRILALRLPDGTPGFAARSGGCSAAGVDTSRQTR